MTTRFADAAADDWHGWSAVGVANPKFRIYVGPVPGRKRIALYTEDGSVIWTHAYFRSETEAQRFLAIFDALMTRRLPEAT